MYSKKAMQIFTALLAVLLLGSVTAWGQDSSSSTLPPNDEPPAIALPTEPPPVEELDTTPIPEELREPMPEPEPEPQPVPAALEGQAQTVVAFATHTPLATGTVLLLGGGVAACILLLGAVGGRKGRRLR